VNVYPRGLFTGSPLWKHGCFYGIFLRKA